MYKIFALALTLVTSLPLFAEENLFIDDAIVRAPIPGVPNTAAFMVITNEGAEPLELTEATCAIAQRVELHTHIHQDGMMKMRQVSAIEIPAHGSSKLKPGGAHIMLFGVDSQLKDGDTVSLELSFSDGHKAQVQAKVQDMMAHKHHH